MSIERLWINYRFFLSSASDFVCLFLLCFFVVLVVKKHWITITYGCLFIAYCLTDKPMFINGITVKKRPRRKEREVQRGASTISLHTKSSPCRGIEGARALRFLSRAPCSTGGILVLQLAFRFSAVSAFGAGEGTLSSASLIKEASLT